MCAQPVTSLRQWDDMAPGYEAWYETPLGAFVIDEEVAALRRSLRQEGAESVVEIGAGTGHVSRILRAWGYRVAAVEPSPAMRAEGRARSAETGIEWFAAAAEALPFEDCAFDGALFFTSLEFVEHAERAIAEALRVVRPGGWLAAGMLDKRGAWVHEYRLQAAQGERPWAWARFFSPAELELLAGMPAERIAHAVFLGPDASSPFDQADREARAAGAHASFAVLRWNR
jgi:SAM-dependent methyltransferase